MEIRIESGKIVESEADVVVAGIFEETEILEGETAALDTALGGSITDLISAGEITGKLNQQTVMYSLGKLPATRVALIGLGKKDDCTPDRMRGAMAEMCRTLQQKNVTKIAAAVFPSPSFSITETVQAMTEGALLGTYSFRHHMTKEAEHGVISDMVLVVTGSGTADAEDGAEKGRIIADAVIRARNMVNEPANFMTPSDMADMALKAGLETGMDIEILDKDRMKELGMGGLLGVAAGTDQPPKFIIMRYSGGTSQEIDIALIGKGITFDSGGISIKPSAGMEEMKDDMAGGASVIAAMGAIASLKPSLNVVGLVPATENLPSGKALKPGDVITAMGGKTIEIISTDAEGRLALADAIGYARKLKAKRIVDIATLTGAMVVALGDITTGAFTNDQALVDAVLAAGKKTGEPIWQMPMFDEYKELNKSEVADVKNVGGRSAGSITAAQFLSEFVDDVPWVHLDIAGTAFSEKTANYIVKGATGVPVRTLVNLVMSFDKS